jgi:hypothetical protein
MKQMLEARSDISSERIADEIDRARAQEYALLATLLSRSPDSEMIGRLALLRGDASPVCTENLTWGFPSQGAKNH